MASKDDVRETPESSSPAEPAPKSVTHAFDMEDGDYTEQSRHAREGFTANDKRDMSRMGKTQELRVRSEHMDCAHETDLSSERFPAFVCARIHGYSAGDVGSVARVCVKIEELS